MAWNEPGNKDPWGNGNRNNDGPPDLDDVLKNLQNRLSGVFGGGGGSGSSGNNSGLNKTIVLLVAIVIAIAYFVMGAGIVNEQERAVVLRFGKYHSTKVPGFRWNPPLIDQVYTVNTTKVRTWSASEQMLTKDLNIVDMKLSVQYNIEDARQFVLAVRSPEESLRQAVNSAIRHVVGSNTMDNVLTQGRQQVAIEVQERLQAYLNSYETGIRIETVNIEDANPPAQVQDAFDDVIRAEEDEAKFKNQAQAYANSEIPQARGQAQRMREESVAYREEVIARAEGQARRFELLLAEYKKSPQVTRERLYLDAVQEVMASSSKVLIDVEGGNNMMYIPLDKIMTGGGSSMIPRGSDSGTSTDSERDTIVREVVDQLRREGLDASGRREGR